MNDNLSSTQRAARNIAAARRQAVGADNQGKPTGKPRTYTYDRDGLLVDVHETEAEG